MTSISRLALFSVALPIAGLLACGGGSSSAPAAPNSTLPTLSKVTTLSGIDGVSGAVDGPLGTASFQSPAGIVQDSQGNLFVADESGHAIRKITPSGVTSTFAGVMGESGTADGTGSTARFYLPCGLAIDTSDNLYVAEYANHTIRKVTPNGVVSTLAGLAGTSGPEDGQGSSARFTSPIGLAIDKSGNLFVADCGNRRIRKIAPAGIVSTIAGAGTSGSADGAAGTATFERPFGIAVDDSGTLFVTDFSAHTIRKISGGMVSTVAGTQGSKDVVDGLGAAASFSNPSLLSLDEAGNLYVGDYSGSTLRRITPGGQVTTVGGKANTPGYVTGSLANARFNGIYGVLVRGTHIYISEKGNYVIQLID
ncbi:MAG: hypothetical protein H6Q00_2775 [Holophagaceae bacterium]|nr:hypothetical protein [Holophagaceae bacterium]